MTARDGTTVTIVRTGRPYALDLCDAYNAAMSGTARRRGLEWFVDGNGNVKLGYTEAFSRQNSRLQEQRRETASARALQRSFGAMT